MISVRNVQKAFGPQVVLRDISFDLQAGERASLVGPGGSGKTTILKVILGLVLPDEGDVRVADKDLVTVDDHIRRDVLREVGMAFQQGGLFDFMTVADNLRFAMKHMRGYESAECDRRIQRLLNMVKLGKAGPLYPHELSGGMQRRVGIARALGTDPRLAIFDEPTAGLDPVTSTIILNMIRDLGAESGNPSQLVCTSNVEIAVRFAPRIILIRDGVVVADGPWRTFLVEGDPWVRHFLGTRFIGLDREYAESLDLPAAFMAQHWS